MPVTYVTADIAGEIESPVYAVLKLGPEVDNIKIPEGYQIEQHMAALPSPPESYSMKWDGDYYAALSDLEKAKNCYQSVGLDARWQALVAEIRREHHRKSGFMPGFERIIRGAGPSKEPSFLDRARGRWARTAKV